MMVLDISESSKYNVYKKGGDKKEQDEKREKEYSIDLYAKDKKKKEREQEVEEIKGAF
jgi:hypothetical protein